MPVTGLAILLLWLSPGPAAAQQEEKGSRLAEGERKALAAWQRGDQQEAIRLWQEVLPLATEEAAATLTWNLAMACEETGWLTWAWAYYRSVAQLPGERASAAGRKALALERKLAGSHGRLLFSVEPATARLVIERAGEESIEMVCPQTWWLAMGEYRLVLSLPGYEASDRHLQVVAGRDHSLEVKLNPVTMTAPARVTLTTDSSSQEMAVAYDPDFAREPPSPTRNRWKWAVTGVGAGLLGAGAALHISAAAREASGGIAPDWWSQSGWLLCGAGGGMAISGLLFLLLPAADGDSHFVALPTAAPGFLDGRLGPATSH